ncbi:MAG: hypothetical protein Tsb0034_10380 [Ekhidna sp.]
MENKDHIKKVAIAICTYKRPKKLREALQSVRGLIIPTDLKACLIVIDNSPSEEVKSVFDQETNDLSFKAEYVTEFNRGIVYARNRALAEAKRNEADYLAFFDDDDYPNASWLESLWLCKKKFDPEVVSGRMLYHWPERVDLDEEIKRLYDNALGEIETGTILKKCGSGNVFVDLDFIKKHQLQFHPTFNMTGGEDSHFFECLTKLGGKIVWCNEAVINSNVDISRATESFVIGRRYNVGYTRYLSDELIYGQLLALWKSFYYCIDVWIRCFFDLFRKGSKVTARTKRRLAESKGRIDSILGKKFENYAEIDGE